jgi:hypothetical protein
VSLCRDRVDEAPVVLCGDRDGWTLVVDEPSQEMIDLGVVCSIGIISGQGEMVGSLYLDQDGVNQLSTILDAYGVVIDA